MMQSRQTALSRTSSTVLIAEILFLGVFMGGCATVIKGSPNQPAYQSAAVNTLVQKYSKPDAIPIDPEKLTAEHRN